MRVSIVEAFETREYLLSENQIVFLVKLPHKSAIELGEVPVLGCHHSDFRRLTRATLCISCLFEPNLRCKLLRLRLTKIVHIDVWLSALEIDQSRLNVDFCSLIIINLKLD